MKNGKQLHPEQLLRHMIGAEQFINTINKSLCAQNKFPPYNIEQVSENRYSIHLAVAGYKEEDIDITQSGNTLKVKGVVEKCDEVKFLYQGIAQRNFEQKFTLGEYTKVTTAKLEHGMLSIAIERELPEEERPRTIALS